MCVRTPRKRLMDAAPGLFASKGYRTTSISELVHAAGCSRAAFYRHFASKDDLLEEMGQPFIADVDSFLASVSLDLDADRDRISVLQSYVLALGVHRAVAKVLLTDSGARDTRVGQTVLEQQRSLVARLAGARAPLRQQVRARCAVAMSHLMVGELYAVPVHRLRPPLLAAAIETLVPDHEGPSVMVPEVHR